MENDLVTFHWIYKETMSRLAILRRRVQEGRDVLAASEFARWLEFSGILKLMEANAQDGFFKVDGAFMRQTVNDLIALCNDRLKTGDSRPTFDKAEFESLHTKVDRIAGYLSRLSVAPVVAVSPARVSEAFVPGELRIFPGTVCESPAESGEPMFVREIGLTAEEPINEARKLDSCDGGSVGNGSSPLLHAVGGGYARPV